MNALEVLGKGEMRPLSELLGAAVELCGQRLKPRRTQYKTYEIKFLKEKKKKEIKSHGRRENKKNFL